MHAKSFLNGGLPMYLSVCVSSVSCPVNTVSVCLCVNTLKSFLGDTNIEEISWTSFDKGFNVSVFKGDVIAFQFVCI